jgi:hypothetical protein
VNLNNRIAGAFLGYALVPIPALACAAHLARRLHAPLLGAVPASPGESPRAEPEGLPPAGRGESPPAAFDDVGRRLRLAARRADVDVVVVVGTAPDAPPTDLVGRIKAAALRPDDPVPAQAPGHPAPPPLPASPIWPRRPGHPAPAVPPAAVDPGPPGRLPSRGHAPIETVAPPTGNGGRPARLRRVCALDDLDHAAEARAVGVVVLATRGSRRGSVDRVRDLLAVSGWPLLGVLADDR